ncbi:hypothetical protein CWB73_16675 [Pseudoalteromonas phenolica]|uniref:Aspartyl/asparaginy/proline hydroxylase domain-containing protein n=1 Tax=Pseudoalteromonas phenolica TaxID=161398 RepID=A0A5S3YPJ1_9GAMM|nr:aspartyl/asparaginyl beta-hydroxylase domain-containing protein [Pseudoalteromonas phenolica]TMP78447.1 hypothetical protein CWB73_16675 [Pseudoalteromonas phenolica]
METQVNVTLNDLHIHHKLIELLDELDSKSVDYDYIYICARKQGKKLRALWFSSLKSARNKIKSKFTDCFDDITSFELEALFSPQSRQITLQNANQSNSYRGKRAVLIDFGGRKTKWSSLEMIARNLSYAKVCQRHLAKIEQETSHVQTMPITRYKTKQFYINLQAHTSELFRGNHLITIDCVNKASFSTTTKAMTQWMANQVHRNGYANYKYWPSRDEYATSNNAIRQWMATICLNRAAKVFNNTNLANIAASNLAFNLMTMYRQQGELGYIWLNGSAKLGAAGLAALAILESPQRQRYLQQEYGLRKLVKELSNPNGSFDTFYVPRDRKDNQNFYSGEALLFWATELTITRNNHHIERFMKAFNYYRRWHLDNRNPAFVPWHTQAYFLVWQITKNDELKNFIFQMNDWLLEIQQWETAEFSDMQGRFYDPKRAYFGPPHASSTGVYLEGLIDAYQLAKYVSDHERMQNYRVAILRGIRSIMQLQFKSESECYYIENPSKVLGGIRTTVYDNTIRIDNVQHALMAFYKINARFTESDFLIDTLQGNSQVLKQHYKHFKQIDFPIPYQTITDEINKNKALWLINTSRQDNIKVQRETNTIFLRSALKPLPAGISGNDFHQDRETAMAQHFPQLMHTLYQFAESIEGQLSRVTIVRLKPDGRVYPHIDEGEYYKYRDRYHIVIDSPEGSEMIAGDEKVIWQQGEFWWFDNKAIHEAKNHGRSFRVHIIFDVLPAKNKDIIDAISTPSHPQNSYNGDVS